MTWQLPILVAAVAASLTNEAWADAAPFPFFRGEKLDIHFRFENLDEYPKFEFFLRHMRGKSTWDLERITGPRDWTNLHGLEGSPGEVFLIAVPIGKVMPSKADLDKEIPPGILQSQRLRGANGVLGEQDNRCNIRYRVRLDGDGLEAELIEKEGPPIRLSTLAGWCAVAAFPASVVIVIFIRWRSSSASPPTTVR
jgi:hypothetical protein